MPTVFKNFLTSNPKNKKIFPLRHPCRDSIDHQSSNRSAFKCSNMSLYFRFGITLLFLQSASSLFAMYSGNPSSPMMPEQSIFFTHSWFAFKAGYEFDDVFERKLKMESHHVHANDNKYTSRSQFGVLTLVLCDRVEFYSGLGSMKPSLTQHVNKERIHYDMDRHFAYSIGGRALFAYWGNLQFGLTASYLHFFPDIHSISVNRSSFPKDKSELRYHEWQVGASFSYHIWWLFPYVGLVYSHVNAQFMHLNSLEAFFPKNNFTLESKRNYGMIVGLGLAPEIGIGVNVEGRFIDETALTVSADVRF